MHSSKPTAKALPKRLLIVIGGPFGPSYSVTLEKGGRLTYTYWSGERSSSREPEVHRDWQLSADLFPLDPRIGEPSTWDNVAKHHPPNTTFPRRAEVHLNHSNDKVSVNWKTDIGTASSAELPKSRASEPTEYEPLSDITS
jgi:hypothetical protein